MIDLLALYWVNDCLLLSRFLGFRFLPWLPDDFVDFLVYRMERGLNFYLMQFMLMQQWKSFI